jgi:DNA-binding PadR family transcriptional regulator
MSLRRGYRTLLAYLVLNLLVEAPMHPYEMKRLIRQRGKDMLIQVNLDSLYHAIGQLERAGLIEAAETSREGRRPERTVYRATDAGRDEVRSWMAELLTEAPNEFPQVIAALSHLPAMTPEEVREHLERRAMLLEMQLAASGAMLSVASDQLPRVFLMEGEYAYAMKRAELDWVRAVVDDLASGRLAWSDEEVQRADARFHDRGEAPMR